MNRGAPPDRVLCRERPDAPTPRANQEAARAQRGRGTLFHRPDGSAFNVGGAEENQTAEIQQKKTTFDAGNVNLTEDLLGFRQLLI